MFIAITTPESPLRSGGGIATYTLEAAKAHLRQGRRVKIFSWRLEHEDGEVSPEQWVRVHPLTAEHFHEEIIHEADLNRSRVLGWEMRIAVHLADRIELFLAREKPDVMEGTDYNFGLLPILQRARARLLPYRPVFVGFHHGLQEDIWRASGLLGGTHIQKVFAAERNALRYSDIVIAPSEYSVRNLSEQKGIDPAKVHLLREPYEWQDGLISADERPLRHFGYFGRVSFAKGLDRVFRFFEFLLGGRDPSHLTVIGPQFDFPMRKKKVHEYVGPRSRQEECITFVEGRYTTDDLDTLLAHVGTFLNFSRTETFSYTSVEALARGMRVITDRDGPAAELYPAELRDLLPLAWDTSPDIVRRAEELITHDVTRAVRNHARQLTDPDRFAEEYGRLVGKAQEALARPASRQPSLQRRQSVSALIATRNDGDLLLEAIESLLVQSRPPDEIIAFNDASTDGPSISIYRDLAEAGAIRLIDAPVNIGLIGARNALIEAARSDYIVFLDADDTLQHSFLEKSLVATEALGADAIIPWRQNFGNNEDLICDFLLATPMHLAANDFRLTALIRTQVARQVGFRPDLFHGEADDWDFWLRFGLSGFHAEALPEPLFKYRMKAGSMSHPWSEGQARLSADLIATSLSDMARKGRITPNHVEYLFQMLYSYKYLANQ